MRVFSSPWDYDWDRRRGRGPRDLPLGQVTWRGLKSFLFMWLCFWVLVTPVKWLVLAAVAVRVVWLLLCRR